MALFFITFAVIGVAVLALSLGVLFGRGAIKGSCGGLKTIEELEAGCPVCGGSRESGDTGAKLQRSAKCS